MTVSISVTYETLNASGNKPLVFVLKIEGLDYIISTGIVGTKLRYGYPGIEYGDPGLTYGCIVPWGGLTAAGTYDPNKQKPYLNLDKSGMVISQKIEQWEGKSSVSTLSFVLTDVNQEMLALSSPGVELSDILLKKCELWVGFEESSYPEDYIRVYRGFVSSFRHEPGLITLGTSDPNLLRRQKLWEESKTYLTGAINNSVTTIPVSSTTGFYKLINAPGSASPEPGHQIGIKIDDEIMTYTVDPGTNQFTGVTRGALGTLANPHNADANVTPVFYMEGNPLRLACKLMLSGWGGVPFVSGVEAQSFRYTGDPVALYLDGAVNVGVDLVATYGLAIGDVVTTTGATNGANNVTEAVILEFRSLNGIENSVVILDAPLVTELTTSAVMAFRSQFDVYPIECGVKMTPDDVDTQRHIDTANQFLIDEVAYFKFTIIEEEDSAKDFIEKELYAPAGAFSLTRGGRLSVVVTAPPLPQSTVLTIDDQNVLNADKAITERAVNTRKFYNVIAFSYDHDAIDGEFFTVEKFIDSNSLVQIPFKEYIDIESRGMRTDENAQALTDRMTRRTFERYGRAAETIQFKSTWGVGALLEAGDIVLVDDQGDLLFPDLATGTRGIPLQLWEVLEKSLDLKTGQASVTLINGTGAEVFDRYGTISPSSVIESGISTTQFRLERDSFGALFPDREYKKWEDYVGLNIAVLSWDYTTYEETTLLSIDPIDQYKITVAPPLSFTPSAGMIMNLAEYSTSPDKNEQGLVKLAHAYLSPVVAVVSGASTTQFDVGGGDVSKFWVGGLVRVHDADYTLESDEVEVTNISGTTITVSPAMAFTPSASQLVTGIGFSADETQTYRYFG